jgi:hypothetical protein
MDIRCIGNKIDTIFTKPTALDIRLWLLFLCDGKIFLHEVSKRLKISIKIIYQEAKELNDLRVLERGRDR